MSTVIFYFTGTGNSLAVAKSIGARIESCTIKPIVKAAAEKDYDVKAEKVGFVFPLYYVGMPKIVQEYMKEVRFEEAKYIFAVVTKAWPVVGGALNQMKYLLKAKHRTLDAGMYIRMPSNDITITWVDPPLVQRKLLAKSVGKIDLVSEIINNGKRKFDQEPLWFLRPLRNRPFTDRVNREDQFYTIGSDCTGCGICAKVCPLDNIKIMDCRPQWQGRCEQCLACYHFCPQKTIYYKGQQANGLQYHHPDIKSGDISSQKI